MLKKIDLIPSGLRLMMAAFFVTECDCGKGRECKFENGKKVCSCFPHERVFEGKCECMGENFIDFEIIS